MAVTTDLLDGINAEAKAYQQAKARYEKAFRTFQNGVPPLSPEHFWPMADVFRKVVLLTMIHGRERIGEAAADEFMRRAAIGELPWSVSAAVHFCLSYRHYADLAHAGGDKCKFGFDRGDVLCRQCHRLRKVETQPVFRRALEDCDQILRPLLQKPLLSVLYDAAIDPSTIERS